MLEHVNATQNRFVTPGLAPDPRRVALGRFCVVLLPTLERVVGLLRGLSQRTSLDDLLPATQLLQVVTALGSRELLVKLPVLGSLSTDALAATAALMGGLTFTGTAKHFVKYRDRRSPLGYDTDSLYTGPGDFVLYADDFVQAYEVVRELAFDRLALGLALQRDQEAGPPAEEPVLLQVAEGLGPRVASYLHRNNRPCQVSAGEAAPPDGGPPGGGPAQRFTLLRAELEPRMLDLFGQTPGITRYRQVTEQAAVELGYRHPLELTSCTSIFAERTLYLFSGSRGHVQALSPEPTFVDAGAVVQLRAPVRLVPTRSARAVAAAEQVQVPLRLVLSSGARPPVAASRVPLAQAGWLKRLVYLLPPQVLQSTSVCLAEEHIFLLGGRGIEYIPLGLMFSEQAPGVLVSLGHELQPRVHPEVLQAHLSRGASRDALFFFSPDEPTPVALPRAAFSPLSRRILADVPARPLAAAPPPPADEEEAPRLINDPVGPFPLWGFAPGAPRRGGGP